MVVLRLLLLLLVGEGRLGYLGLVCGRDDLTEWIVVVQGCAVAEVGGRPVRFDARRDI